MMRTKISRWITPSLIAMSLSGVLLSQASYADVELPIVPASVMKQSATANPPVQTANRQRNPDRLLPLRDEARA